MARLNPLETLPEKLDELQALKVLDLGAAAQRRVESKAAPAKMAQVPSEDPFAEKKMCFICVLFCFVLFSSCSFFSGFKGNKFHYWTNMSICFFPERLRQLEAWTAPGEQNHSCPLWFVCLEDGGPRFRFIRAISFFQKATYAQKVVFICWLVFFLGDPP